MRKKIDNRIRVLIENGVARRERSMFVIVGDHGRDQVVILHHMLSKALIKARPSVLWCYKKELGFSSHRKKRMKQLQKKIRSGKLDVKDDDPFELFIASTQIRYCYYGETHKILGNTYGMCILQDFEALQPNLLARTIETVEGGGIVVILLRSVTSLKQLYTMTMDCHSRYRTEAHKDVVGRFNERLVLSLASCRNCMVINDQLDLLPITSHMLNVTPVPPKSADDPLPAAVQELKDVQESLQDTQPIGTLVNCCKTLDQAKCLLKFVEAISEKTLRTTVAMTAARGRGKSAALGLSIATAVAFGYSNVFVTAPSPENLKTLFEFVFKGFDALEYQEHMDYELVQSTNPEFNKAIVRVNIFKEHRQTIQYIHPSDGHKLGQAELLIIDEAAAIPLPLVKSLLGPYLVFMASTVNGYEGTGRSLSLKLIHELRQKSALDQADRGAKSTKNTVTGRSFYEISLEESIRYADGDAVEKWLNDVLCLDLSNVQRIQSGTPLPQDCELYYVNRDTLFSYHKASENFLQRVMSLYVASHYKNSPNDLQLLSDAPAHHIFCLLGPVDPQQTTLPEVLCVLQVCLEGEISKKSIMDGLSQGKRASGDLIPWTISQQFQDHNFGSLSGCRVVRIATHPDYQQMGYGTRTLQLLEQYYEGRIPNLTEEDSDAEESIDTFSGNVENLLEERIAPRKNLPSLLVKLSERKAEKLDYLGVSFGLTRDLLRFWKKSKFVPVYLRQNPNDLTGEHTCIMLRRLHEPETTADGDEATTELANDNDWLSAFWFDFRRRAISLMGYDFRKFHPAMVLNLLQQKRLEGKKEGLTRVELDQFMTKYDVQRLELYSRNMVDYHLIMDLLPTVARLYFQNKIDINVSMAQAAILMMFGLQYKNIDDIVKALDLPHTQVMGLFSRTMKKIVQHLSTITEIAVEKEMRVTSDIVMEPVPVPMHEELAEAGREVETQQKKQLEQLKHADLAQYAIKGSEHEWSSALGSSKEKKLISIGHQSLKRKPESSATEDGDDRKKKKVPTATLR